MARIGRSGKLRAAYGPFIGLCWDEGPGPIGRSPLMDKAPLPPPAERCILQHRLFTSLGNPLFRRAETGGMPAMVMMLSEQEAVVSLRSLQHEFGISDDSADGRMLGLIA